jgi:tetratricopeptide (TPR) repeat protein
MFFPRLRRRARWVFAFLAGAFALSVVFFGVGTGISGANPWDAISDFLSEREAGSSDVNAAAEEAEKKPNDAAAQIAYASALQRDGRTTEAIGVLQRYTVRNPRDTGALRQLASLWGSQAARSREEAEAATFEAQEASIQQAFSGESEFGRAITQNQIAETLASDANVRAQVAQATAQSAAAQAQAVYQQLTLLEPDDATLWLQLGSAAQEAQDYEAAVAAYEKFIELAPNDSSAPVVQQQIELLKQLSSG